MGTVKASTAGALLLLIALGLCSALVHGEDTYMAAVVEHVPIMSTTFNVNRTEAQGIMQENLDLYEEHITRARATAIAQGRELQIIVFPEDGLYGASFVTRKSIQPYLEFIPEPVPLSAGSDPGATPCDFPEELALASPALVRASCMAREANLTIVLNMGEVQRCSGGQCPSDGHYQYNTQIALAETGQLIGKYHKSHLYYEPQFDEPHPPEIRYFDTSFGVRFGMMICFDVMFQLPQLALYEELGIRDFTWTSWWVNFPALITGTQTEVARSSQLPSNFLASGIGLSWYNSGSGIFSNGQPLRSWYNPTSEPKSHVMVAEVPYLVPEYSLSGEGDSLPRASGDHDMEAFRSSLVDTACEDLCCGCGEEIMNLTTFVATTGLSRTYVATSRNLTCTATVEIAQESDSGPEEFAVVALTGMYNTLFPAQICALLHCGGDDCSGLSLHSSTLFASWSLSATVDSSQLFVMYPLVAEDLARIPPPSSYSYSGLSTDTPSLSSAGDKDTLLLNAALFGLNRHLHMPNTTQALAAASEAAFILA